MAIQSEVKQVEVKLIGGPLSNRTIAVPTDSTLGQIIEVPMQRKTVGPMTVEEKHHYRLGPHPTENLVLNWINPADRRQHGR